MLTVRVSIKKNEPSRVILVYARIEANDRRRV
jgi:hypothetical protein